MGAQELSTRLWQERELLDLLVFKLEEEQLLLTSGKTRWLPFATREVEQVLERLRVAGVERTVEVAALAAEWGLPDDATLRALIDGAPSTAWADAFRGHLQALTDLTAQITALRDSNLQYLRAASRSTQETLARLDAESGTYDASGEASASPAVARLFESDL
ncbi:flagellar protein FlgN [Pseudolysinimonas sp.]|uniref:flagellar protein FlgN n=1 Tax=Pseudolysinimonas sp. TaxID=2680009 RepID=UPI003F7FBE2C